MLPLGRVNLEGSDIYFHTSRREGAGSPSYGEGEPSVSTSPSPAWSLTVQPSLGPQTTGGGSATSDVWPQHSSICSVCLIPQPESLSSFFFFLSLSLSLGKLTAELGKFWVPGHSAACQTVGWTPVPVQWKERLPLEGVSWQLSNSRPSL